MKRAYLTIILISLSFVVSAQRPKVHSYYDEFWRPVENEGQAHYYRIVEKQNGKFLVKDYFMSGALQAEILCTGLKPTLQFDSKATLFHENGKSAQVGYFRNEKPYGFHQYFDSDGKLHKEVTFKNDKEYYHQLWSEEGDQLLVNGSGNFSESNSLFGTIYIIVKDSLITASYYINPVSTDTIFTRTQKLPEYQGGSQAMTKELKGVLKYPKSARRARTEGVVYVRFVVTKGGQVKDCSIVKGLDEEVDIEAINGVSTLQGWIPGTYNGKKVNVAYIIPIRFNVKGWF